MKTYFICLMFVFAVPAFGKREPLFEPQQEEPQQTCEDLKKECERLWETYWIAYDKASERQNQAILDYQEITLAASNGYRIPIKFIQQAKADYHSAMRYAQIINRDYKTPQACTTKYYKQCRLPIEEDEQYQDSQTVIR